MVMVRGMVITNRVKVKVRLIADRVRVRVRVYGLWLWLWLWLVLGLGLKLWLGLRSGLRSMTCTTNRVMSPGAMAPDGSRDSKRRRVQMKRQEALESQLPG